MPFWPTRHRLWGSVVGESNAIMIIMPTKDVDFWKSWRQKISDMGVPWECATFCSRERSVGQVFRRAVCPEKGRKWVLVAKLEFYVHHKMYHHIFNLHLSLSATSTSELGFKNQNYQVGVFARFPEIPPRRIASHRLDSPAGSIDVYGLTRDTLVSKDSSHPGRSRRKLPDFSPYRVSEDFSRRQTSSSG